MSHETHAIITAMSAENLLADSDLLVQIKELRASVQYKTDGTVYSYDDYYLILQKQIEELPRVNLQSEIAPHTESQYQIQLVTALETVYDDCERILSKLLHFLSKLKVVQGRTDTLKASFVAWYALAAAQYLTSYDIDLGKMVIADLAKAEFERLMLGLDIEVATLVEAVQVQIKNVNKRKQTAQEKFNLGKDQANAVWTGSLLPGNVGTSSDEGSRALLEEEEEEIEEIRGVFVKHGDPMPARVVDEFEVPNGDSMTNEGGPPPEFVPRKRHGN